MTTNRADLLRELRETADLYASDNWFHTMAVNAAQDVERMQWLEANWNSQHEGRCVGLWISENMLHIGGVTAAVDHLRGLDKLVDYGKCTGLVNVIANQFECCGKESPCPRVILSDA